MFNKLKTNYRLSNLIVRILFVLAFVFCSWQDMLLASNMVLQMMELPTDMAVPTMLLSGALTAVLLQLTIPFLTNVILNFAKLYNLPRAEYNLIVLLFFTIGYFACGLLNLVNLFTPILITWGSIVFPFLVSLGCVIGFYCVTSKMYFNDVTRPYYFKMLAIVYFVTVVLMEVTAL